MPASTIPFNAPEQDRGYFNVGLAANVTIFAGCLVALNAAGNAVLASDTANLRVIGRAEDTATNGATAGAVSVTVKRGVFRYQNSGTAACTIADVGKTVFVEDDTTIARTGGTNSIKAGVLIAVSSEGCWVDTALAPAI